MLSFDEFMFFGGLLCVAVSVVLAICLACVAKVRKVQLQAQLDKEYGPAILQDGKEKRHVQTGQKS